MLDRPFRAKSNPLRRPPWLKISLRINDALKETRREVERHQLNTVCASARCPNLHECWSNKTATFMILGDICTRRCTFCSVGKGKPAALDPEEPEKVAEAVARLNIRHAVITSVNRDDLPDGGAAHFAQTIRAVRARNPKTRVEVLIPDFDGNGAALETLLAAAPDVLGHNLETVRTLYSRVRPNADYHRSLKVLQQAKLWQREHGQSQFRTKAGIMVGLGETWEELLTVFVDLRGVECDVLTVGQYLNPSLKNHVPVEKFYSPEEFDDLKKIALTFGFLHVEAGPFVRSSYHAHLHGWPPQKG